MSDDLGTIKARVDLFGDEVANVLVTLQSRLRNLSYARVRALNLLRIFECLLFIYRKKRKHPQDSGQGIV